MFRRLLNKVNPVVVEIGVHYGEDTLRFLEAFPECKIYCFEPDPRNIKIFKKYVKDKRAQLYEIALSNENGEANFYQSFQKYKESKIPEKYDWISLEEYKEEKINNSGSSSLKKGYKHTFENYILVKTERFDNWYKKTNIDKIDLAWIDVQGAEKEVIEGMGDEIKNIKYIWIEYGEKEYEGALDRNETILDMAARGYKVIQEMSSFAPTGDLLFEKIEQ